MTTSAQTNNSPTTSHSVTWQRRRRRKNAAKTKRSEPADRAGGYFRFSSNNQRDESNADQQRECRKAAESNGHRLLPELEFSDEAVSGTKRNRAGLNAMLDAAEAGELDILYIYSLSRLARESVITMPILKRLVPTYGVRFISVTEGIDSDRDGWEMITSIYAAISERFIKDLSVSVLRGQEGALLAKYSIGDWCFGYASEPVPGTEQNRRGRKAKPRMRYVIDPVSAAWVVRVFHWFVVEERSISWIVRELNRQGAPKDHRSTTAQWYHGLVVSLLSREKYVGTWPWGEKRNVRDPETGDIRQKYRDEEECQSWTRQLEHLRLIDDKMFAKAQQRLEKNAEKWRNHRDERGQLRGSPPCPAGRAQKGLLNGLVQCRACGNTFRSLGHQMKCSGHFNGTCGVRTALLRELAEQVLLDEIGRRIAGDAEWSRLVFDRLLASHRELQARVPAALAAKQQELDGINRRIDRLLDAVEDGQAVADLERRLQERYAERTDMERELQRLKAEQGTALGEPTEEWLRQQLDKLGTVLRESTPAANTALRTLLVDPIEVEQVPIPLRKRCFLRGRFRLSVAGICAAVGGQVDETAAAEASAEIVIDFMVPKPVEDQRTGSAALR